MLEFDKHFIRDHQQRIKDEFRSERYTVMQAHRLYGQLYLWVGAALLITALISLWTANSPDFVASIYALNFGLFFVALGLFLCVFVLLRFLHTLPLEVAGIVLLLLAAIVGGLFSSVFQLLTHESVERVFFVAAAAFLFMAVYGLLLKRDLGSTGNIVLLLLLGVVLAWVANSYVFSPGHINIYACYVGVVILIGCAAIAMTDISLPASMLDERDHKERRILACRGALLMYLLFTYVLTIVFLVFAKQTLRIARIQSSKYSQSLAATRNRSEQ